MLRPAKCKELGRGRRFDRATFLWSHIICFATHLLKKSIPPANAQNVQYNVRMPIKNRRTVQTPLIIMGDLDLLTKQELAEFIDSLNEDESSTVST